MKRLVCTVCSVLLCVGLLSGCGTSLEGEESVVYVGKKGVIESLDVESLDQSYYDETELKSYVDAERMTITYNDALNTWEKVLNAITFGYYAYNRDIDVTVTSRDEVSNDLLSVSAEIVI